MKIENCSNEIVKSQKWKMLIFYLVNFQPTDRRYCRQTVYDTLNLFIRSKNCYRELSVTLALH